MTEMITMIHKESLVEREVEASNANKIAILKRAGFIRKENLKPRKKKKV